jgi:hypothetical protein
MLPVPGDFTPEFVVTALEEAGRTLLSLPITGVRPAGYRSNMPEVVRQFNESYGTDPDPIRAPTPSSRAISQMDVVLNWIALIPADRFVVRRVVQCRSLTNPITGRHLYTWSRLGAHLHCDYRAAQRWHAEGIATIVTRLNQPGLCALAAGAVGPGTKLVNEALARIKAAAPARKRTPAAMEFV